MTMTTLFLVGILPAVLVVLAGMLIVYISPAGAANQRFLLFLLAVEVVLFLVVFVAGRLPSGQSGPLSFQLGAPLAPTLLGLLALILTRLQTLRSMQRREKVLAGVLALGVVALVVGVWLQPYEWASIIVPGALLLAAAWTFGNASDGLAGVLTLVGAAEMVLFNWDGLWAWTIRQPYWIIVPLGVVFYIFPGVVVAVAAIWVKRAIGEAARPTAQTSETGRRPARLNLALRGAQLALAAALLGGLAYTIAWTSIWDQTSDGLGGIWLAEQGGLAAIGAGILLGVTATGWRRGAGLAFGVLAPLVIFGATQQKWQIYHPITEARAARIQQAVEQFHARVGRYPTALEELVPRDLLWVPGPVILQGEGWCYQGTPNSYRLGTYYREAFSMPLSFRIYASAGVPLAEPWACADRLAELKARHDPQPFPQDGSAGPTPTPLPVSVVPIPRTPVQLLVQAKTVQVGTSWSPDGAHLVFGVLDTTGRQRRVTLNFLNATTGEVCPVAETFPGGAGFGADETQNRYAWLPDGRLLYLSTAGELVRLTPCHAGVERLTDRYSQTFSRVAAFEGQSGHVLLLSQSAYWLLDGGSLAVRPAAGVSPNPYDLHWDHAAWSPSGDRVAISRLNGRDQPAGSTLYVVAAASGEVVQTVTLAAPSDQSAPMVDWLTDHELLVNGETLALIELQAVPPKVTPVLKDIFGLNVAFPDDVASTAWLTDPSGQSYHLVVRLNHPANKATYLYHSETGQVEVLHPEADAIFFFPGGNWAELRRVPAATPPSQDAYELFWTDALEKRSVPLVVEGHTPRSYPALDVRNVPVKSALLFGSSQGISEVRVPDGQLLTFWELKDRQSSTAPYMLVPPAGGGVVVVADGDGLYFIKP